MTKQLGIIHLDMDAFFASVEVLDNPMLSGKPVIVGGTSNRGVVSAASYESRKYGVHSAMPIVTAKKLCPSGIFLPPRFSRYQEISDQVMAIFRRYTPLVEPLSLDEAFLDVSESTSLFGPAIHIAKEIRRTVREELGLTISAGVASSKLIAKTASDFNKPDGLTVVDLGMEKEFLAPLPIKKLWGVGQKTMEQLEMLGITTIGELSRVKLDLLEKKFGKRHGAHLFETSHAIDNRKVNPGREIKSIGNEDTFADDLLDLDTIRKKLLDLSVQVGERVRKEGLQGKTISIKVKYYDFSQVTRSITLGSATAEDKILYIEGLRLLEKTMAGKKAVRLLGLSVTGLTLATNPRQGLLFDSGASEQKRELSKAIDVINEKYRKDGGKKTITPGRLLD